MLCVATARTGGAWELGKACFKVGFVLVSKVLLLHPDRAPSDAPSTGTHRRATLTLDSIRVVKPGETPRNPDETDVERPAISF